MAVIRSRRFISLLFFLVLLASCSCSGSRSSEYYVSPNGSDGADGSFHSPWATFAKAVSEAIPGDTIYFRGGTYIEQLSITVSGEEGNPITFAAYPGEAPVIDGTSLVFDNAWQGLINIDTQHDLVLDGITARDTTIRGIMVSDSQRIEIRNNTTINTDNSGIQAWGNTNLIVDGNEVDTSNLIEEGSQECISISHSSEFEITNNIVHDGFMEGIDIKNGAHDGIVSGNTVFGLTRLGIYIDGYEQRTYNIDVFDNTVYECVDGVRVNCEQGGLVENINIYGNSFYDNVGCGAWIRGASEPVIDTHTVDGVYFHSNRIWDNSFDGIMISVPTNGSIANIEVFNNVITGSGRSGIQMADFSSQTGDMDSVSIVNNTLYNNGTGDDWGCGGIYMIAGIATDTVIHNNIVSQSHLFSIGLSNDVDMSDISIQNNLIDNFMDNGTYLETRGYDYIELNPLFSDESSGDYHLQAASPAIDTGTSTGAPDVDFDGVARPQGVSIDIGAFEYVSSP